MQILKGRAAKDCERLPERPTFIDCSGRKYIRRLGKMLWGFSRGTGRLRVAFVLM
jgi:hypothetical protein